MNIEKMKEIVRLQNELREEGVYGFHMSGSFQSVSKALINEPDLKLKIRGTVDYPYEIYVERDGIKIFAILKTEELKDFPQFKEEAKAELRKHLAYLEDDIDLSGMEEEKYA